MKPFRPIGRGRFRRNRNEAELQETRALLDAALEHAPLVFYAKDGEGRFTVVNTEFERIAGRPRGEIVGRTGEDLLPTEDGERFSAHERETVEAGGTELFEEVVGGRTYVSLRFGLTGGDGAPPAWPASRPTSPRAIARRSASGARSRRRRSGWR